jgi:hypothetical protein
MVFLVAIVVGFAFGGADQYLGSRVMLGPWAWSVSVMSAPWLVLPFLFGWSQKRPRRATLLGLVVTGAALVGYFALTLSPLEGVPLSRVPSALPGLVRSQLLYIIGGAATGPLYGMLGQRWRVHRSWASAGLVAGALCLEPLARLVVGRLSSPDFVWQTEVVIGTALALFFLLTGLMSRRAAPT